MSDCIFCKLAGGEIPTNMIYQNELVACFADANPQAPVHVLVVPKCHIESADGVNASNSDAVKAVFEAIHGSVPHRAGTNTANPMALLLSGVMMLRHLGEEQAAQRVEDALVAVIGEGTHLPQDLGGKTGTQEFADAIIEKLR